MTEKQTKNEIKSKPKMMKLGLNIILLLGLFQIVDIIISTIIPFWQECFFNYELSKYADDFEYDFISMCFEYYPIWFILILNLYMVLMIIFTLALLFWRKWGFWGIVSTYFVQLCINAYLITSLQTFVLSLIFPSILCLLVFKGKENSIWNHLK